MSKLRKSAKGQTCTLQIAGVCNRNPETTVLAHLPSEWGGMGKKSPDFCAAFACSSCHDQLDGRTHSGEFFADKEFYMRRGLQRTLKVWFDNDLVKVS